MKKLILAILLIPALAFAQGAVNCNDVPNSQCRDSCLPDEYIITKVKVIQEGEHKNKVIMVLCNKEKIDPNLVCCTKDKSPKKKTVK